MIDKVLNFFISGNITFNQADNPAFQELLGMIKIEGQFMKANRKSVCEWLDFHAENAREDLMVYLIENDSEISLALDCWTSGNHYAFMGIFHLMSQPSKLIHSNYVSLD